uniref:KHA domain-containing protein n=1 Tax=Rhizophora mucronata TaxID=61149 RepID=A0A2P2JQ71_RHIMU
MTQLITEGLSDNVAAIPETSSSSSSMCHKRVIIHGHDPKENMTGDMTGKLINLPDSIEDLFQLAGITTCTSLYTAVVKINTKI